jgi:hypothetical protein
MKRVNWRVLVGLKVPVKTNNLYVVFLTAIGPCSISSYFCIHSLLLYLKEGDSKSLRSVAYQSTLRHVPEVSNPLNRKPLCTFKV